MITLTSGKNDSDRYTGKKYGAICVTAFVSASAVNTGLVEADFLPQNLTIQAQMQRSGITHDICNGNGDSLLPASNFETGGFDFFQPGFATNTGYQILVAAGVAVKEQGVVTVVIPFGGVLDLTKGGVIELKGQASTGIFSSAIDLTLSNITLDLVEVEGQEAGLPQILTQVVTANEVNPQFSPGNGTKSVYFINRDKSGITTANQVISAVNVEATGRNSSFNYQQLLAMRSNSFQSIDESQKRAQSFCLLPYNPSKLYFGVNVKPTLTSANVTASKNYFVAWRILGNPESLSIGANEMAQYRQKLTSYLSTK